MSEQDDAMTTVGVLDGLRVRIAAGMYRIRNGGLTHGRQRVSFGAGGKIGEVEDEVAFVRKIQDRVLAIFSRRSKAAQPDTGLTVRQFANRWRRKDWWLDSDESLRLGIVDEVR